MAKYTGIPRVAGEQIVWDPGVTSGHTDGSGGRISVKKVGEQGFATKDEATAFAESLYPQTVSNPEASESMEAAAENRPAPSGSQRSARTTQKKSQGGK